MSTYIEHLTSAAEDLGRSRQLVEEIVRYAERLEKQGVPVIFSRKHLAMYLGLTDRELNYLIDNRSVNYKFYEIRKKKGGFRQIVIPYNTLRRVQLFLKNEILDNIEISQSAFGFVKGRSILDNARIHSEKGAILNIDLLKFFDSITESRVYGLFKSLGYVSNLAMDMARLVTVQLPAAYYAKFSSDEIKLFSSIVAKSSAVLPQGASTSPIISNLILRKLDLRLSKLALRHGIAYSRYADDITFSGKLADLPTMNLLKKIVKEEGFIINPEKVGTHIKGRKQVVTGLTVSNNVHVPRAFKKEVAKHIYCCTAFGVENHLSHLGLTEGKFYKEWLLGKIYFVMSIERATGVRLLQLFEKINWPI